MFEEDLKQTLAEPNLAVSNMQSGSEVVSAPSPPPPAPPSADVYCTASCDSLLQQDFQPFSDFTVAHQLTISCNGRC